MKYAPSLVLSSDPMAVASFPIRSIGKLSVFTMSLFNGIAAVFGTIELERKVTGRCLQVFIEIRTDYHGFIFMHMFGSAPPNEFTPNLWSD